MINIVLYEPEIPENTGNIMRTCVATNAKLHLIEPFGFIFDENRLRRSGANYIDKVNYEIYLDYNDFLEKNTGKFYYFTRYGNKPYSNIDFSNVDDNVYLIFGKESTGIPKKILNNNIDKCYRIPTSNNVRALNLSNCVALVTYEALRQQNFPDLFFNDPFKGKNYLNME